MACIDCLNNCPEIISDKCVVYTGPDVPLLGICSNSSLSTVESIVINKLLSALDGTGIVPDNVTLENCADIKSALGTKDPNLNNLLQVLIDNQCTLKEAIDALATAPTAFDTKCLVGLTNTSGPNEILQAVINTLCSIKTVVDGLPTTYVKISDLKNQVIQIIQEGNGNGVPIYKDRLVPYVAYEYYGPLSNFDNNGKGIASLGFDKVYICNGSNGTPDRRGRVAVGAVRNIPGGSLDSAVNPLSPSNPNTNYSVGDKFGENYVTLTTQEIPPHTHGVTDPGHDHTLPPGIQFDGTASGGESGTDEKAPPKSAKTTSGKTNISIQSTGGGQPHNNRQPSIAAIFIMHIP